MYSIYQLYCMNGMKTPFTIRRRTWGKLTITVDHVENFHYSARDWRCDAYTTSEAYSDYSYGTVNRNEIEMKAIGCSGNYCWQFVGQVHNEALIKPYREHHRPKSDKGLTIQKANKFYTCNFCKAMIIKGIQYEKYTMRDAGRLGAIKATFCIGCRDKLREHYFGKSASEIKYRELLEAWDHGILV